MAGNSQRKGATRKPGTKKGAVVGSGGQRRRGLEPKGSTPPKEERDYHPAARKARAAAKRADSPARSGGSSAPRSRRTTKDGGEYVAGRNSVVEALRAVVPATALYVQSRLDSDDRVREALKLATERRIPLIETTKIDLDRMTDRSVHQGLLLTVPPYEYADLDELLGEIEASGDVPLLIALDGVTDPRNLGAVVRSAAAFGAHGVVIPERRAAGMTAAAWKVSAGAAARVPVVRVTNLTRALVTLQEVEGATVVGLAADGGTTVRDIDRDLVKGPLVLVVGSEGKGLSRLVGETCDVRASIPMISTVESLNAGVAAGIALYAVADARSR